MQRNKSTILSTFLLAATVLLTFFMLGYSTSNKATAGDDPLYAHTQLLPVLGKDHIAWRTTCVECTDNFGSFSMRNFALDSQNQPRLVIGGEQIYSIALDDSDGHEITRIAPEHGHSQPVLVEAMSLDNSDTPTIALRDGETLQLVRLEAARQVVHALPAELQTGVHPILHFADDTLHMAVFQPISNTIVYGQRNNEVWVTHTPVLSASTKFFDMTVNADGEPLLAWGTGNTVHYVKLTDGVWEGDSAEMPYPVRSASIAIDDESVNHLLVHLDTWDSWEPELYTLEWREGEQPIETIVLLPRIDEDVLNSDYDTPYIEWQPDGILQMGYSYDWTEVYSASVLWGNGTRILERVDGEWAPVLEQSRYNSSTLGYAFWQRGEQAVQLYSLKSGLHVWAENSDDIQIAPAVSVGENINLHVDSQDNLHLGYRNRTDKKVQYAMQGLSETDWAINSVLHSGNTASTNTLLAANRDGKLLAIAFNYARFDSHLDFVVFDGTEWTAGLLNTDVWSDGAVGVGALDNAGNTHLIYSTEATSNHGPTIYRYCPNAECGSHVEAPSWAPYGELLIDSRNIPHAIYTEGFGLHIATLEGTAWSFDYLSLQARNLLHATIDSTDRIHALYAEPSGVSYMVYDGDNVESSRIEFGIIVDHGSIFIDERGDVHVSYFDSVERRIRYAFGRNGTWQSWDVATDGQVGPHSAVVVRKSGEVVIAWQGRATHFL